MMDETNITNASSTSQISPLLLGHLFSSSSSKTSCVPTSTSTSTAAFQGLLRYHLGRQMPVSFSEASHEAAVPTKSGTATASLGFDPVAFLQGSGAPAVDLDPYDGESEDGADISEERPRPPPPRSGSKRSRAAEVHNLSEKRRRSRINEKMKALQNLIPNSNKTDKASMLDEAIEYLKELQLQVQMLSMRNGISLQSMYLPSTLQSLHTSQVRLGLGVDNSSLVNMGVGTIPGNQDSPAQNYIKMSKHCTPSHQHMMPGAAIGSTFTAIGMEAPQFHHTSFPFSLDVENTYKEGAGQQHHLESGHVGRNLPGDEMKSINTAIPFEVQEPPIAGTAHPETCMLCSARSEDILSKGQENQVVIQQLHRQEDVIHLVK